MKIGRVHLVPEVKFRGNLRTKLHKKIHILYFVVFKITLVVEESKGIWESRIQQRSRLTNCGSNMDKKDQHKCACPKWEENVL